MADCRHTCTEQLCNVRISSKINGDSTYTVGELTTTGISGLVVEYIVAIDVTRVRFPADALLIASELMCAPDISHRKNFAGDSAGVVQVFLVRCSTSVGMGASTNPGASPQDRSLSFRCSITMAEGTICGE